MPNHYDKLKESASPTERKKTLTDAQVRGRAAIKKRLQTQEENKKKETAAKNKIQAEKSKVSLAKAIELGKKRHAKRQKDANKKPSSNLPPWIERKVQREVDSFKAMYDDKRSKRKEKESKDIEKRRVKLAKELGAIADMKTFEPEDWDKLSDKEKLFFKNKNAAKIRRQNEILGELNKIRESQGKDPIVIEDAYTSLQDGGQEFAAFPPGNPQPRSKDIDPSTSLAFDAEGDGYNQARADELGYKRDKDGHLPSIDSETGMVLKGKNHPTWDKTVAEEKRLGNKIIKKSDGNYYTVKDNTKLAGAGGVTISPQDSLAWKQIMDIYSQGNQTSIDSLDKAINALSNNQKVAGTKPPSATEALKKFLNK